MLEDVDFQELQTVFQIERVVTKKDTQTNRTLARTGSGNILPALRAFPCLIPKINYKSFHYPNLIASDGEPPESRF